MKMELLTKAQIKEELRELLSMIREAKNKAITLKNLVNGNALKLRLGTVRQYLAWAEESIEESL